MKKKVLLIAFLILLSFPSIVSLFHPGFFQSDDGEWMIIRFSAFHEAFRSGQFPVRFLGRLNYGYGYPVANFLYPGFMYLAEIPKILGFGFVNSIKVILGLSMIGSVIFIYFWLRKFFGKFESLVGSLFYLYAPYHLFDLYKRGSVGETLALAVVPFILWQIERNSFFWITIGIAFLILAHNILAVLFLFFIIVYLVFNVLISSNKNILIYYYTSILVLALGLSSFFWLPAVFDLQYTVFQKVSVSDYSKYFADANLIGFSTLFIFLSITALFLLKEIKISKHRLIVLLFVIGLISVFFATSFSSQLWKVLPVFFMQFPFRVLSITILCTAFLASYAISVLTNKGKIILGLIFLAFAIFSAKSYIIPSRFFDKGEGFYATNEGTTTVQDEYMPKWVEEKPKEHFKEKVTGTAEISNLVYNSRRILFNISSSEDSQVSINTVYFPGFKAFIDEKATAINYNNRRGVINLKVSKGKHTVKLLFSETPFRLFTDFITIISFILLLLSLKFKFYQNDNKNS